MLRALMLSVLVGAGVCLGGPAAAKDAVDRHIAELNQLMTRSYETTSDPVRRARRMKRGRFFSVDADRTRLQFGRATRPDYLQIPFESTWTVESSPPKTNRRARAKLKVTRVAMTAGRPGKPRRPIWKWNFHLADAADAARVAELLRGIQAAAQGRAGASPVAEAPAAETPVSPKPDPSVTPRRPAFTTTVSPLKGTHTGEPIEITVEATPDSWLTAFAQNDGKRKMFQAVAIIAPDGRAIGGGKAMDTATGRLRFGHIARTPTGAGGQFTIRIVPLRGSRGPFHFEGRIVHPTRASRPETDLCDGLDLLMAHIDDGLGHLVETDPTKPGRRPVPLTLAGDVRGHALAGHTWVASVVRGDAARAERRMNAMSRTLDGCYGAGRTVENARAKQTQRTWTRGEVTMRLRLVRDPQRSGLELAVYKGDGPI